MSWNWGITFCIAFCIAFWICIGFYIAGKAG